MTKAEKLKILYEGFARCGITNDRQIAEAIGMPYMTLHGHRLTPEMIGEIRLREFWAMQHHGQYKEDEVKEIAKA